MLPIPSSPKPPQRSQEGFALVGLVVAIFIILLMLSIAAPTVARSLRRDRELETVHRAQQFDRAIQLYYKKVGSYPGSLEQLEKTNNIRYLRQKYNDPMTGKPDWRLIHVGQNKTTVKGFFGQPLGGLASTGLGSAAGMASSGGMGTPIGASSSGSGQSSAFGSASSSGVTAGNTDSNGFGSNTSSPGGGSANPGSGNGLGAGSSGQSGSGLSSSGGPIMGVGLPGDGSAILVVNEQTTYPEWEFLYDPRVEQLKAKVNIFGGGMTSNSASGLGTASSLTSGMPSSPTSTTTSGPPAGSGAPGSSSSGTNP